MRVRIYFLLLLTCLTVLLATYQWPVFPWEAWPAILLLIALAVLAESLSFELPVGGRVSLAFSLYMAGLLYAGPLPALAMAAIGAVPPPDIKQRKPLFKMAFNVVMLSLSVLLAGVLFLELGGVPLVYTSGASRAASGLLVPVVVASSVMLLLNTMFFSLVVSLSEGVRLLRVWRDQNLVVYLTSFVILALLGFGMAQLIAVAGWSGAALLVVPFAVARQTFQVYRQLADAYTETIRSFVAAIEAKDPYTRGHSERVAQYSRSIAQGVGMRGHDLERVEFAALLHDVGKIGVSRSLLMKPGQLTAEEFAEIRLHPQTGCVLVESVEFLADIVPMVRFHHERLDGTGYPDGVQGSQIPFEARILGVADAYDAMTSDRPYRRALSHEEAVEEMLRVAGTQLDPQLVAVFVDVMNPSSECVA
ncbi:MAG: HD-GYP domain-containing protein [Coriobacteriia bacterium]|nr:HD-GYP domain-containing protein [Coriobacteriia bacterium]MBN2823630.1 HD-GYP domain-containing protein [Coriobacteriia bacterium]